MKQFLTRKPRIWLQRFSEIPVISFIVRIARELGIDGAGDMAGSIAYYTILSIFPLLLGVIAILGLFLPSDVVQEQIFQFFEQYLPGSSQVIERNIENIIALRGTLGIFSIIGLFWTGSAIFGAFGRVINRAWGIHKYRSFFLRKARDITLAVCTSLLFILSMVSTAFSSVIPIMDLPALNTLVIVASRLAGFILIFATFSLLYKFMPNTKTAWRYVWLGAVVAAVLFEIARSVFTIYLNNFATYDMVYGSLAAVIVFLVWIYFSAFFLIIGAEIVSEYGRMRSGQTSDISQ